MIAIIKFKDDPEEIIVKGEKLGIEISTITDGFYIKDLEKKIYIFYCDKNIVDYARILEEEIVLDAYNINTKEGETIKDNDWRNDPNVFKNYLDKVIDPIIKQLQEEDKKEDIEE